MTETQSEQLYYVRQAQCSASEMLPVGYEAMWKIEHVFAFRSTLVSLSTRQSLRLSLSFCPLLSVTICSCGEVNFGELQSAVNATEYKHPMVEVTL